MQQVSEAYLNAAAKATRQTISKIVTGGVTYIDELISHPQISIENSSVVGGFPSKKVTFEMYCAENINLVNEDVYVYRGLYLEDGSIEYVLQGIFSAGSEDIELKDTAGKVLYTGYDRAIRFDAEHKPNIQYPCTYGEYINDVILGTGVELADNAFPLSDKTISKAPNISEGTSKREILSKFAEIIGAICVVTREGKLSFSQQKETPVVFDRNYSSLTMESVSEAVNQIIIRFDDSEDIVYPNNISNSKSVCIYNNPFCENIADSEISMIASNIVGKLCTSFEMTEAIDDYYIDLNDIVTVIDKKGNANKVNILSNVSAGRIKATFKADVQVEQSAGLENSVKERVKSAEAQIKKLDSMSSDFAKSIEKATQVITGAAGGCVSMLDLDGDGQPDNFFAGQHPVDWTAGSAWRTQGPCIRVNYKGIGVSTSGADGPYEDFAVYYDETLKQYVTNASLIKSGILQGIKIIADMGVIGGLTIGKWTDENGVTHDGLKRTFLVNGNYYTFAIDGTGGTGDHTPYLLQLYLSDENGNVKSNHYTFALGINGSIELPELYVNRIYYKGEVGWVPVIYSEYFQDYSEGQKLKWRKSGDRVEIRGACKPKTTITGSATQYTIASLGESLAPSSMITVLCQGSSSAVWLLQINTSGDLTFSRYREGAVYKDVSNNVWLPIHVTYFLD